MLQTFQKWLKYPLRKTETRLILFLTIAVFFVILIVSITSYQTSKSVLQEELNEPQQQMLQVSMNVIEQHISDSDNVAIMLALNPSINRFLNSDIQNSYNDITEIYQLLSTFINSSSFINSIYIYDIEHDSFVSMPQGFSSRKSTFYDSKWVDVADEFGDEMMLVKKRKVHNGKASNRSEVTLFRKIMNQGELKGIIAINLGYHHLFEPFHSPSMANLSSSKLIIDQNNDLVYSTSVSSSEKLDTNEVIEAVIQLDENHLGDITYNGKQYLVSQNISPLTGWKYISLVPQDSLLAKSKKVGNVVLLVSIFALLVSGVAIFYINSIAFRPIRRMKELFNMGNRDMDKDHQDLLHLETLAGELLTDYAQLSYKIRRVRSEASAKFFSDIYHKNITNIKEIREKCKGYFQDSSHPTYKVAIISIDHFYHWTNKYPSCDHSLLKFALTNILTESLALASQTDCVDLGKDKLMIVLKAERKETLFEDKIEEALSTISSLLEFSISVGVSDTKSDFGKIVDAIAEAEKALGQRLFLGYGSLLKYEDISHQQKKKLAINDKVLDQLSEAINTGDSIRANNLIDQIIEEIRNSCLMPERAFIIINRIGDRSLRLGDDEAKRKEREFFNQLHTMYIDDIADFLIEQAEHKIQEIQALETSKESILIQKMIEYMKAHIDEPIGITEIVDSIGISVSLASSIFKKEMNETIYGYFTNLRMKLAADLLVNTEEKVSDIAIKVGYQHENSFIRAFRKCNNITPGKYRELYKGKKEVM